ncbi:MAG TPA: ChbG/HpnK family deacetylase [Candidatus Binataceae bacterium]
MAQRLGYSSTARLLIVNADDFGMSDEVNRAIVCGLTDGVLTSASAMVSAAAFPAVVEFSKKHRQADIGIHLTLTSEWDDNRWGPVAPTTTVPSLADGDSTMWRNAGTLYRRASIVEVEIELRAQIDTALNAGLDVSHLDSHMFTMHSGNLPYCDLYARLGDEYSLPIRAASALLLSIGLTSSARHPVLPLRGAKRALLLRSGFASVLKAARKRRVLFPDNLVIMGPTDSAMAVSFWSEVIDRLPAGVTEIYCHPAIPTPEIRRYVTDIASREADFQFFTSERARSLLSAAEIKLLSYKTIRTAMRDSRERARDESNDRNLRIEAQAN